MSFSPLITFHIALGELAALSSLWIIVEILEKPSSSRLNRALAASIILALAAWLSYLVGGYYYVTSYGPVKAVIKEGSWSWAHGIFMEVKEHIFLVGPYIAVTLAALVYAFRNEMMASGEVRKSMILLLAAFFIGVAIVLGFGVMVSTGYRVALAAGGG